MSDIIKASNLNLWYGTNHALKDINLSLPQKEITALIGPSGCGKSTFLKTLNRMNDLVEGCRIEGLITLDDIDIYKDMDVNILRKRVGMVFQNPDNQQIASIVEDDIAFGPENLGLPREEIKKRIDYALKVTDTEKFRDAQVSRLSGGQKQRVAIAGAIAINPEVLILDESTSMLDPKGRSEVMEVVRSLNKQNGMTVIDITHYMDEAIEADKVLVMGGGEIAAMGTPDEIFKRKDVLFSCGLDLPVSAKIAEQLRELGLPIPDRIIEKEKLSKILCELLQKI